MAFELDLKSCQQDNCSDLVITDTSIGWITDVAFADITTATLTLTDSTATVYTYDILTDITGATTTDDLVYTIENSFADGYLKIVYTVIESSTTTYTKTLEVFLVCNIDCCIDQKVHGLADYYNCSKCNNDYILAVLSMKSLRAALMKHVRYGNLTEAQDLYTTLENICDSANCEEW